MTAQRRLVSYNPPPDRPAPRRRPPARPVTRGRHNHSTGQARLALACLLAVIVFCVVCFHVHSSPAPEPSWGGSVSGPAQYGPHNPGMAAAVIGGEAKAVGHAAGFAGRMAARGVIMRGLGRGFGGGYSTGTYTPGGFSFGGFSFGGF